MHTALHKVFHVDSLFITLITINFLGFLFQDHILDCLLHLPQLTRLCEVMSVHPATVRVFTVQNQLLVGFVLHLPAPLVARYIARYQELLLLWKVVLHTRLIPRGPLPTGAVMNQVISCCQKLLWCHYSCLLKLGLLQDWSEELGHLQPDRLDTVECILHPFSTVSCRSES